MTYTVNATGWNELMNGSIGNAAYLSFNTPLNGYLLLLLFCVVTAILILNTGVETSFVVGCLFLAVFSTLPYLDGITLGWLNSTSFSLILLILGAELGGVFYKFITKT